MKSMVSHLQDTPFYLDQRHRKVFVDFGNSLPIHENGTLFTDLYDSLLVALPLNEQPSMTCSDDLLWLGVVYNQYPNWYQNSAGVQIFPALGSLSENEMEKLNSHPLVVIEVHIIKTARWVLFISKAFQSFVYRSKITTPRNYEIHIVLQGHSVVSWDFKLLQRFKISGGGLPYKRLMGMCRWMGSHFHDWIDYNGVALFSI